LKEKAIDSERLTKALHYFEVDSVESMTIGKANRFIDLLNKY
jgi:hypothetical protein